MSRHRNIHNLTDDDYYDDYDDYYDEDDYYEDDDAYYREQERLKKEKEAERARKQKEDAALARLKTANNDKKKKAAVTKGSASAKFNGNKTPQVSEREQNEKERLVTSMGFSSNTAKDALARNGWDAQRAINDLLGSKDGTGGVNAPSKGGIMAAPPGFSKPPVETQSKTNKHASGVQGFMAAPPGLTKGNPPTKKLSQKPTLQSSVSNAPKQKESNPLKKKTINDSLSSSVPIPKKKIAPEFLKRLKAQKSRLSMVILGHVDAGKSTLMGQVLVQLGIIQKRTVFKYQKQAAEIGKASFALAWIMDEDESERERGVTIDIATKHVATPIHDLTILDAPGHADYVPAMITGAASADVGLLVVAATTGEFEAGFGSHDGYSAGSGRQVGQTREHITLSRGLGVSQLIVAVNKLDAAEPAWSKDRFDEIRQKLSPFLKANGFNLKKVTFIPISGLSGVNIKESLSRTDDKTAGLAAWYKGKTLLQAIDSFEPARRSIEKPFRFIASDMYAEGKGIMVKGRVVQGFVTAGDKIAVLPLGDEAIVSRVEHGVVGTADETHDFERMKVALAGDSVDLYLTGIDIARTSTGNIIADVNRALWPKIKRKVQAQILVMDQLTVPIIRGAQVLLHMHSLDIPAVISNIVSKTNKKDGSIIKNPRILTGGSSANVEIKLSSKVCLEAYNDCRALGRFVLRRGGDTVAVGIVEQVL